MTYDDWIKELKSEQAAHGKFRERAQKVVDRYEDEDENDEDKFNILWSNTEVLSAALYAKTPSPDIRRRNLDRDPAARKASDVSERAVSYALDVYDFDGSIDNTLVDYLVPGLGQQRIRYTPYFEQGEAPRVPLESREKGFDDDFNVLIGQFNGDEEVTDYEVDESGYPFVLGEPEEELVYEEVTCEPVYWKSFRWQPAKRWEDVDWCCIEHYMSKEELEEAFGEEASQIPLTYDANGEKQQEEDKKARGLIYEIFDKKNRVVLQMAEGYKNILDEVDDPLGLEGFYPFPKPLMATLKSGKFLPIPDYIFYQDQANELDRVTARINALTEQLKYRGVYDGMFEELQNISNNQDGEFVPIADFQVWFDGKGDLSKVIAAMPLEEIQRVLVGLYQSRDEIKQVIYEITGIADIMRGSTNSSETLGAQQLKTQFGSMRLSKRQKRVAQFIKEIIKLKVEVMVENFDRSTLEIMTGMEIDDEVYEILTNDLLRSYRIDIETDSTITEDAAQEKQQRIELVTAVTGFAEKVGPLVQAQMMPANVAKELLGFAVRGFKIGRTLEDTLDEIGGDSEQDPRVQEMQQQMQAQVEQMKEQAQQFMQQMQEASQKEIKALEGKLFQAEKKLAINAEASQARIVETKIKSEIQREALEDKTKTTGQLEIFKAQLDAILKMPEDKSNQLSQEVQAIGNAFMQQQQENQSIVEALSQELKSTQENVVAIDEYMKRPVKVLRDEKGKVVGASRD